MNYDKIKDTDTKLKTLLIDRNKTKGFLGKFDKTKVVYKAYKEVSPVLKKIAVARHDNNMDIVGELYKKVYVKIGSTTSIKRTFSKSEIQKIMEQKDYLGNFPKRMVVAEKVLNKAQKYINKGTSICNIGNSLYGLYVGHSHRHTYRSQLSRAKKLRLEMQHGQRQMMHVMSIAAELASFAPPGIKEYLEYNMAAFQACGKTFDRVNKYAAKIEKLSNEVEHLWSKVYEGENTVPNAARKIRKATDRNKSDDNWIFDKWPEQKK